MAFTKVEKLYNLHHIPILNNSIVPKIILMPIYSSSPVPCPASGKHSCTLCLYNFVYSTHSI